jgi:hypothetical protein
MIIFHNCCGLGFLFTSRVSCMTSFWPFGVYLEILSRDFGDKRRSILSGSFLLWNLWCSCLRDNNWRRLLLYLFKSVRFPLHLIHKLLYLRLGCMNIQDIFVLHSHLCDDPTWIIVPQETCVKLHFLQKFICLFPDSSTIAYKRSYLPLNPRLLFLLQRHKVYII